MKEHILIDMDTYARREHLAHFLNMAYPYTSVTVMVDVSDVIRLAKAKDWSFFLLFLHFSALAADGVRQLRQRCVGGQVIEFASCDTSHVELLDNGTYVYCSLGHHMPLDEYMETAAKKRLAAREQTVLEEHDDALSMYFVSCLPWLHYVSLEQPLGAGEDCNPRISWGKYEQDEKGRWMMPVTLCVHHGLADGLHMGMFYQNLERIIKEAGNEAV